VHSLRRARGIEQGRLCEQHKWTLSVASTAHGRFRGGDLLKAAAQMDRSSAQTF
jgi:hypothetical protein